MSPVGFSFDLLRQTIAVGAWLLLIVLTLLVPADISAGAVFGILLLVSCSSAVSLSLISENWSGNASRFAWRRTVSIVIAFVIPLSWMLLLGTQNSGQLVPVLLVLAIFPVVVAWLTLPQKPRVVGKPESTKRATMSENKELNGIPQQPPHQQLLSTTYIGDGEFEPECVSERELPESADVTQWLTRSMTIDGEFIEGGVRVDFTEGQRDATVHVSFCPPLHAIPEIIVEDLDGADLEIRVSAIYLFGTRLNVRRPATLNSARGTPISSGSFRIGFVAVASPIRRVA